MIHYTFDVQSNLNHDSAKQYYFIRDTDPNTVTKYMGGISHESDEDLVRLQIADLLAWHVRRSFAKPQEDKGQERAELLQLRQGLFRGECAKWNPARIAQLVVDVEERLQSQAPADET